MDIWIGGRTLIPRPTDDSVGPTEKMEDGRWKMEDDMKDLHGHNFWVESGRP